MKVKDFTVFKGRVNRWRMFSGSIILGLIGSLPMFLVVFLAQGFEASVTVKIITLILVVALIVAVLIPAYLFQFSLYVRRLHDIGASGAWVVLAFVPFVSIIFGLVLLFKPGEKEANKYGKTPEEKKIPFWYDIFHYKIDDLNNKLKTSTADKK